MATTVPSSADTHSPSSKETEIHSSAATKADTQAAVAETPPVPPDLPPNWGMPQAESDPDSLDPAAAQKYQESVYDETRAMKCITQVPPDEARRTFGARLQYNEGVTEAVITGLRIVPTVAPSYKVEALDIQLRDCRQIVCNATAHQDAVRYYGYTLSARQAHLGLQTWTIAYAFRAEAQKQLSTGRPDPEFMRAWRPIELALQALQAQKDKTTKGKDDATTSLQSQIEKLTETVTELGKRITAKDDEIATLRQELAGQPAGTGTGTGTTHGHGKKKPAVPTNVPPGSILPTVGSRKTPR